MLSGNIIPQGTSFKRIFRYLQHLTFTRIILNFDYIASCNTLAYANIQIATNSLLTGGLTR